MSLPSRALGIQGLITLWRLIPEQYSVGNLLPTLPMGGIEPAPPTSPTPMLTLGQWQSSRLLCVVTSAGLIPCLQSQIVADIVSLLAGGEVRMGCWLFDPFQTQV